MCALPDPLNACREAIMSPLSVNRQATTAGVLLNVTGELDAATAGRLESRIDRERQPGRPLILDLGGLTFMDSTGLHLLLRMHADLHQEGTTLHVAAVRGLPARILQITGVGDILNVHADVREAIMAARDLAAGAPSS